MIGNIESSKKINKDKRLEEKKNIIQIKTRHCLKIFKTLFISLIRTNIKINKLINIIILKI
jgi:hypothetical protein